MTPVRLVINTHTHILRHTHGLSASTWDALRAADETKGGGGATTTAIKTRTEHGEALKERG